MIKRYLEHEARNMERKYVFNISVENISEIKWPIGL
jgi:hypothetical protein